MKVSVLIVTFNHEKFIAQAIESILMQKVSFEYEIVIGEDYSTDETRRIVTDYHKRFPQKVRLLLHDKNLGGSRNFRYTYETCKGKYVAILEGDDFWTDPDKLQKQVDFLDEHPEYVLAFHQVSILNNDTGTSELSNMPVNKEKYELEDLVQGNIIHTPSVVFRNNVLKLPEWLLKLKLGDWPIWLLLSQFGSIYYLSEPMACYRLHHTNTWANLPEDQRLCNVIAMLQKVYAEIDSSYRVPMKASLFGHRLRLVQVSDNKLAPLFSLIFRHPIQSWRLGISVKKFLKLVSKPKNLKRLEKRMP